MATLAPGTQFGEYRIERELARGGMGVVYKATRTRTGQSIALKAIAPERAADRTYRDRFIREAQVLVGLQHPHIVPLIDWGEIEGTLFLALGYLDGPNLEVLIEREGPFSLARTIELLAPVAEGLDSAHRRGYIHRDVKPANIMLDAEGNVYLTDFGLGKLAGSSGLSQTGSAIGTLAYMSPEQFTGKIADPSLASRTDIYALGCVFHACLTRQDVVPTESYARAMHAVVSEPPPRLSSIRPSLPPELDDVELKALAKDPAERYPTASAFIAAARAVLLAHPEADRGSSTVPPPPAGRQQIAQIADLGSPPPVPEPQGVKTILAPPPMPMPRTVVAEPAVFDGAPQHAASDPPVARPVGRVGPWRASNVGLGLVIAGVLGLALVAGIVVFGGKSPQTSPSPIAVASTGAEDTLVPTVRPITPPPVTPSPVTITPPPPTPTPAPGASDDPLPVAGTWPTSFSTVKAWIPAAIRSTCESESAPSFGEASQWHCSTDAVAHFTGHSISIAYMFYESEADARIAYEDQLDGDSVTYDSGTACTTPPFESGWTQGSSVVRGHYFCTETSSPVEAHLFQTYFGKPYMTVLYRQGHNLPVINTAWGENGGSLDPSTGATQPTP